MSVLHLGDKLADNENQNVLVMDRCQTIAAGDDLKRIAVMLIAQMPHILLCGQGKNGVLHTGHIVFRNGVQNVADEQIIVRVAIRQQRCREKALMFRVRHFRNSSKVSWFQEPGTTPSPETHRGFWDLSSWFLEPSIVVLGTGRFLFCFSINSLLAVFRPLTQTL